MPDGAGNTPVDVAGSHHALRCMAWAIAPPAEIRRHSALAPSLETLAYMQLSTKDMRIARELGVRAVAWRP